MRYYCTPNRIEIRSENAALPWSQTGKGAISYLNNLEKVDRAADYGCGKCRYHNHILERTNTLTLIDSTIQLNRDQILGDEKNNVKSLFDGKNSVQVINKKEFFSSPDRYDRIFIWNVLPIIPFPSVRRNILLKAKSKLSNNGSIELAVNYRNSEYTKSINSVKSFPFKDGYIVKGLRGAYFLSLLNPVLLRSEIQIAGLVVINQFRVDGTIYFRVGLP